MIIPKVGTEVVFKIPESDSDCARGTVIRRERYAPGKWVITVQAKFYVSPDECENFATRIAEEIVREARR